MTIWELHEEVENSQENVKWLESQLKKEKARNKRLQDALIAAAQKARNKK
jgi:chaperonin cofactor prefoldin